MTPPTRGLCPGTTLRRGCLAAVALLVAGALAVAQEASADFEGLLSRAQAEARALGAAEADQSFKRALAAARTDAERARALWVWARAREARGDRRAAVETLTEALELTGGNEWTVRCLQHMAILADREARPDLARRANLRLLELLSEDLPQAAAALLWLARDDRRRGDAQAAADRLRRLLASEPPDFLAHQARDLLVQVLAQAGDHEAALRAAREVPEPALRARVLLRVGHSLLDAGNPQRAMAVAREVLDELPGDLQAMQLAYQAAQEMDALDGLRADLQRQAAGEDAESALRLLAQIAAWEDQPQVAVSWLERLVALVPDDPELRVELGERAREAGDMERAERALRRALALSPNHRGACIGLAEVLVHRGRTDEAVELLKRAVDYSPDNPASVLQLGHLLSAQSLPHAALAAYEEARQATGEDGLFAYEAAQAAIDMLDYERAAEELLVALTRDEASVRVVANSLERLATDEIAGPDVLAILDRRVAEGDLSDRERGGLAQVYIAAGSRDTAFELLAGLQAAGAEVARLARLAEVRGDRELAADLYAMVLDQELPAGEAADVALRLARVRARQGRWRDALDALDAVPETAALPEALLLRADLLMNKARRLDEAREAWERLASVADGDAMHAAAARWGMADWLFAAGRLDEAEQAYAELLGGESVTAQDWVPPLPPAFGGLPGLVGIPFEDAWMEPGPAYVALQMAEIALRRGEIEQATDRFRLLVREHADSDYANDALERLVFIRENLDGEGRSEGAYIEALSLRDRGEYDRAETLLVELAGTRGEPLADDALMLLAEMQAERGNARDAAETWLSVAERFPESLLAPRALLSAARLLGDDVGDAAAAAQALRQVLDEHPESAAAHEARAELELLPEGRLPAGRMP